jgi:murein DD-endopeptidase MepM/ murein hydrolase activator NlpD
VILDHGDGALTVYANLMDGSKIAPPAVGTRVRTGTLLGQSLDRFYFEVRLGADAINPRKVLAASQLSQQGI